jgi:HAD domain in Swiss Army Knife RNA repair proteins
MDRPPPLVLLDVDGVINYFDAVLAVRMADDPAAMADEWDVDMLESHGLQVAIPRYMGELVRALDAEAELWWCTTWRHRANDEIATHLGIEAPVIDDGTDNPTIWWKEEAAREVVEQAVAAGRTVAWIEDFCGETPGLDGVIYIDTTAPGHLRWSDLAPPVEGS